MTRLLSYALNCSLFLYIFLLSGIVPFFSAHVVVSVVVDRQHSSTKFAK